jgi:hypothetical protein
VSYAVTAAGVDTASPAWYVDEASHTASVLGELATERAQRARLLPDAIGGCRVGWFPSSGLMFAEGHPAGDGALAPPDGLSGWLDGLVDDLDSFGLPAPRGRSWDAWTPGGGDRFAGFAGFRRLDATANIAFDSSAEGRAVLAGVAGVVRDAPRTHAELRFEAGKLQTVYLRGLGGRKVVGRWYDKGIESRSAPIGQLLRAEDQRRFVKATRRDVDELTTPYVREKFRARFRPLWQASKGVTVGSVDRSIDKLRRLVEDGTITAAQAQRLAGAVVFDPVWDELPVECRPSRRTRFRHRAELREAGVVVIGDQELDAVEVELADVLEAAIDADVWERYG